MRDARHSHVAVAPRLTGGPFHCLANILNRLRIDVVEYSAGSVSPCNVNNSQCVSAANVEIEITRLDETSRIRKTFRHHLRGLGCFGICVYREQGGELACGAWPEDV